MPRPFAIVVCESVPTTVSGYATPPSSVRRRDAGAAGAENDATEKLDVDLMHDARIGRNRAETVECVLAPFEKRVALAIALELELRVLRERIES